MRRFEAVVCHASRGGVGSDREILFAFSGKSRRRMWGEGLLALKRLGGKGDITVVSDGEDYLKRSKSVRLASNVHPPRLSRYGPVC